MSLTFKLVDRAKRTVPVQVGEPHPVSKTGAEHRDGPRRLSVGELRLPLPLNKNPQHWLSRLPGLWTWTRAT